MTTARDEQTPAEPRNVPTFMTQTWEAATTDADPLLALGATRALGELLSMWESQLVREAVEAGATWELIGSTVGVSRQAAWERFHHDVHDFRRQWKTEFHDLRNRHREEMLELRHRLKNDARSRRRAR